MKMTLCKLIANDIVNYGMDQTNNFNYIVCLDSYIDDFDEESKTYIYNHIEEICNDISNNENKIISADSLFYEFASGVNSNKIVAIFELEIMCFSLEGNNKFNKILIAE